MTDDETDRVAALEARLAAVEARLDELTARPSPGGPSSAPAAVGGAAGADDGSGGPVGDDGDTFWALHGLQARLPEPGGVLFTGSVTLPEGPVSYQLAGLASQLLAKDWAELSAALAALGHPVRLLLLQEVLNGHHAVSELGGDERFGTSGQLYHHLRQLVAAGWLRSTGRGTYAVPARRVVPLLVIVLGVDH